MKKKRFFGLMALLLGLLLVFTLAACGGSDSNDPFIPGGNDGGSTQTNPGSDSGGGSTTPSEYVIFDLTTGTITDYTGPGGNVTIPSSINGKPVTAIGDTAFYDKNLTSVTIPNSVISIGTNAFRSNKLTIVVIPNSVTFIKSAAFYENRLIRITIGGNVTLETGKICFDGYFDNFYRNNSRVAGTYTRPNTGSNDWTRDGSDNPGDTTPGGDDGGTSSPIGNKGSSLVDQLNWLLVNAQSGGNYIVEVNSNESIDSSQNLSYSGRNNITITLKGVNANRTISKPYNDSRTIFIVTPGVTLILDNNITINGSYAVAVDGGSLIMNMGSTIVHSSFGVWMDSGNFTMNGGSISGNKGYGVFMNYEGNFTMNGGSIKGCGVCITKPNGSFTMNGGSIFDNLSGGGVSVSNGSFTMNGGSIFNNRAALGGGVAVGNASFTMTGGSISGNTASEAGGGVDVSFQSKFTKTGGTIYGGENIENGNTAIYGNAVHVMGNPQLGNVYLHAKNRETTAGPSVYLYYDGTTEPATFSGDWD